MRLHNGSMRTLNESEAASKQDKLADKMTGYVAKTNLGDHMRLSMINALEAFWAKTGGAAGTADRPGF